MCADWNAAEKREMCAIALHNFTPSQQQPEHLSLLIGDFVVVKKTSNNWCYGILKNDASKRGVFPQNCVQILAAFTSEEASFEEYVEAQGSSKSNHVVHEVPAVLKQWMKFAENLYTSRRQKDFTPLMAMMKDLMGWRRQVLSEKLPVDELQKLKSKISRKIDVGNKLLELDLVLRDESGSLVDQNSCSILELFALHTAAIERIQKESKNTRGSGKKDSTRHFGSFCLLSNVFDFSLRIPADAELFLSLYDAHLHCYISELFTIFVPLSSDDPSMSKTASLSRKASILTGTFPGCKILFTDFGKRDIERKRIFLVCKVVKFGAFESGTLPRRPSSTSIRQPYAVGAVDVTEILAAPYCELSADGLSLDELETQLFMQLHVCETKVEETLAKLFEGRGATVASSGAATGGLTLNGAVGPDARDQGIFLSTQRLWGTAEEVQIAYVSYFPQPPVVVRKLGFPEVISRDDVRNDLYVTLIGGEFKDLSKDRNIEVKVTLLDENGNSFTDSFISVSVVTKAEASFTSTVYYHDCKPRWNDMLKLNLPVEKCHELHLRFTFKHRSSNESKDRGEKPFALAYLRLVQNDGTALFDGDHSLNVYKCEKKWDESSPGHAHQTSYLGLPSTKNEMERSLGGSSNAVTKSPLIQNGAFTWNAKDNFFIRTVMCSTSLTQNVELLGLLEWQSKRVNLKHSLESLMKQGSDKIGTDIITFLQDILDVLFNILTSTDDYDQPAFDALVNVIALIDERRFHSFKPVMDNYLHQKFSASLVHMKLLRIFDFYVEHVQKCTDQLFRALKSLEYLMKFVVRSRVMYVKLKCADYKEDDFKNLLRQSFGFLASFFKRHSDVNVDVMKCQWAALKYLPCVINDVTSVFDAKELSQLLNDILANVSPKNLTSQKLSYVKQLINCELFLRTDCRQVILPCILCALKNCIENNDELELCSNILTDMLEVLYGTNTTCKADQTDLISVINVILRPVMQLIVRIPELKLKADQSASSFLPRYVAIFVAVLDKLDATSYSSYGKRFATLTDLADFLTEIFMLIRDLIEKCPFPADWYYMIAIQNNVFLKILSFTAATVRIRFANPFRFFIYQQFFLTCVSFITQKHLQLESFSHKKRQATLKRFRDMRLICAKEMKSMWTQMDHNKKAEFIPHLVGQILCVTLIPQPELRQATIPIFLDMLITGLYPKPKFTPREERNKLTKLPIKYIEFEREFISQLDRYVDCGQGDENYAQSFIAIMNEPLSAHKDKEICSTGGRLVSIVQRLMRRLLEYREVKEKHDCVDNRMSCVYNLMEFYRENDQMELYVRYLYKLYDLHMQVENENFVEAARILKLHADQLTWNNDPVPCQLKGDGVNNRHEEIVTERTLKEELYYRILCLYDSGKLWEKGIEICKELQLQYDRTMKYEKMNVLLLKMARLYSDIIGQKRAEPEYFYVAFHGRGFPSFLQNCAFVYRGQPFERISDFNARMIAQFPQAQVSQKWETPSSEQLALADSQFLQIRKVDPILDDSVSLQLQTRNSNSQIQWYYKYNDVQKFSFTRRLDSRASKTVLNGVEVASEFLAWLEQTIVVTKSAFPSILRFSPVVSADTAELSPTQVACDNMKISLGSLSQCVEDFERCPEDNTEKLLALKVQGIVNPAVMGGIANYEKTIFTEDYKSACDKKEEAFIGEIKDLIASQIPVLEKGLYLLLSHGNPAQQLLYEHMLISFENYKKDVEMKYGCKGSLLQAFVSLRSLINEKQAGQLSHQNHTPANKTVSKHNSIDYGIDTSASSNSLASSLSKKLKYDSPMSGLWSIRSSGGSIPRKFHSRRKQSQAISAEKDVASGKRLSNTSVESSHSEELIDGGSSKCKIFEISETVTSQRPPRPTSHNSTGGCKVPTNQHRRERLPSLIIHTQLTGKENVEMRYSDGNEYSHVTKNDQRSSSDRGSGHHALQNNFPLEMAPIEKPPALPPRRHSGHSHPVERNISPDEGQQCHIEPSAFQRQISTSSFVYPRKDKPLPPVPTTEQQNNAINGKSE